MNQKEEQEVHLLLLFWIYQEKKYITEKSANQNLFWLVWSRRKVNKSIESCDLCLWESHDTEPSGSLASLIFHKLNRSSPVYSLAPVRFSCSIPSSGTLSRSLSYLSHSPRSELSSSSSVSSFPLKIDMNGVSVVEFDHESSHGTDEPSRETEQCLRKPWRLRWLRCH